MKTVLYTFKTEVGTFWIRPEPAGRVQLGVDRQRLKTYRSPKAAAADVAAQCTGFAPWDGTEQPVKPASLLRWKRGSGTKATTSAPEDRVRAQRGTPDE